MTRFPLIFLLVSAPALAQSKAALPETFAVDGQHSNVDFRVRFMGVSSVRGEFGEVAGIILLDPEVTRSTVTVTIRVATINTHNKTRDGHLKSPDFFAADSFPAILFQSRRVERAAGGGFVAHGDLTMRGVTRPIALPFEPLHERMKDGWGNQRIGYHSALRLNRKDYNVRGGGFWNREFDAGRFVIGDSIDIDLEVSAIIPNTASWTIPGTDSLVKAIEENGVARAIGEYRAVTDTTQRLNANALFVSAYKLQQRGHIPESIRLMEFTLERGNLPSEMAGLANSMLGDAYLRQGERAKAEASFARALQVDPHEPLARAWQHWLGSK